ncbi:MAG: hypothetical protein HGA54_05050 [Actinobacteria bacterium]|nr:hypothetical protein [Actinomycetota bacterium]
MCKHKVVMVAVVAVGLCVLKKKHCCHKKEEAPIEKVHAVKEPETLYEAVAGWAKSKF